MSAKTRHACNTPEFNFITPAYRYTDYTSPVDPMLNVNWSAFLECILPTPKVMTETMAPKEGAN